MHVVLPHNDCSPDPTRGLTSPEVRTSLLLPQNEPFMQGACQFRRQSRDLTALLRVGCVIVFVPACLLINVCYFWWNWHWTCFHWNIPHIREDVGVEMRSPPTSNPWKVPKCINRNWQLSDQIVPQVKETAWDEAVFPILARPQELPGALIKVTNSQTLPKPVEPESPVF